MPGPEKEKDKKKETSRTDYAHLVGKLDETLEALQVLPVVKKADILSELMRNHRVIFIVAEPGTGKSFGLPPLFERVLLEQNPEAKVMVVESRKKLVEQLGSYSKKEEGVIQKEEDKTLKDRLGKYVDFANEDHRPSPEAKIIFAVEQSAKNIIERIIKNPTDPELQNICIIDDEAHRDQGDLKKRIKDAMDVNPTLRVIFTTGTPQAVRPRLHDMFPDLPEEKVEGRKHEIDIKWAARSYGPEEITAQAASLAEKIIADRREKVRIISFMPGEKEIRDTEKRLQEILRKHNRSDIEIITVMGKNKDAIEKIKARVGKNKIIIATDALEEGVDPDCDTSIVSGWRRTRITDPVTGVEKWGLERFSQNSIMQQAKRAGRKEKGTAYIQVTEHDFNEEIPIEPDENQDLTAQILSVIVNTGTDNIRNYPFERPKDPRYLNAALKSLKKLGAIDKAEKPTDIGRAMEKERTEPPFARMLVEARETGDQDCINGVATIVGLLTTPTPLFDAKYQPNRTFQQKFERYLNPSDGTTPVRSDFIALLRMWNDFANGVQVAGINKNAFSQATNIKKDLLRNNNKDAITLSDKTIADIQRCIAVGLADKLLIKQDKKGAPTYRKADGTVADILIDPNSSMTTNPAEKIVTYKLTTNKDDKVVAQLNQEITDGLIAQIPQHEEDNTTSSEPAASRKEPEAPHQFPEFEKVDTIPTTQQTLQSIEQKLRDIAKKKERLEATTPVTVTPTPSQPPPVPFPVLPTTRQPVPTPVPARQERGIQRVVKAPWRFIHRLRHRNDNS